jgi:hypothetical protein
MNTKFLLVGLAAGAFLGLLILVVLPGTTVNTAVSYGLDYQGYSFARLEGIVDGQPQLDASGSSFERGEPAYFIIYGISGLKTDGDTSSILLDLEVSGQGMETIEHQLGPADYLAPGGYIDNVYGFVETENLEPGKYSLSVTLRDLLGGGFVVAQGEFLVM